jgi:hypothetical protein
VRIGEAAATLIKRSRGRSHAGKHNKPRSSAPRDTGAAVGYCISIRLVNAVRLGQSNTEHRSEHSTDETDQKQTRSSTPRPAKKNDRCIKEVHRDLDDQWQKVASSTASSNARKKISFFLKCPDKKS